MSGAYNYGGRICRGLITGGTYMWGSLSLGGRICGRLITGGTYICGAYKGQL